MHTYIEWKFHYAALLEYCKEHGTCNIPKRSSYECYIPDIGEEGASYHYRGNLGLWLTTQRQVRKGKIGNRKTAERIELLQVLVDEGNRIFNIRCIYLFDGPYNMLVLKPGKLAWELETVADKRKREGVLDWPRHYAALQKYYEQYGTCNVTEKNIYQCELPGMGDDGETYHYKSSLGCWLTNQRSAHKGIGTHKISPEQEAQLQLLVDQG